MARSEEQDEASVSDSDEEKRERPEIEAAIAFMLWGTIELLSRLLGKVKKAPLFSNKKRQE